jgi:bifunctional UDP-N-acetylglucosamine pyrophosphorylase/glucosamine-1-phosphate N-acetyltransferase
MVASVAVVILAAGLGKRMGSDLPKVVVTTRLGPIICQVVKTACLVDPAQIIVVTGHKRELVEQAISAGAEAFEYRTDKIKYVYQERQLGTGDAVRSALSALVHFVGTVIILPGDAPLIRVDSLNALLSLHHQQNATLSLITFSTELPNAYGRVKRKDGRVDAIIEHKDCSSEDLQIKEFNTSIYAVDSSFLAPAVTGLENKNSQSEFYLTDIVARAAKEGQRIAALNLSSPTEFLGINTKAELAEVNEVLTMRKIQGLIDAGVKIEDPKSVYIDEQVEVAPGTIIGPNVQIRGKSKIGPNVVIEGSALLIDVAIDSGVTIKFSVRAESCSIGAGAAVGPFANIRPGTVLGKDTKIGNFVETKKAKIEDGAKASHLTYLGDCHVGANANIGAGTITCNYDGYRKYHTEIGSGAFIGSNTALVAPVEIGEGAYVGAGSTITKPIPKDGLGFSRPSQITKEGWAKRWREKNAKK